MREDYIKEIIEKLNACDDLSILDLVSQLLDTSIQKTA